MATDAKTIQKLVNECNLVEALTEKLIKRANPGSGRLPAWHPGYLQDELVAELPAPYGDLIKKDDFWDSSFVKELTAAPQFIRVTTIDYPSLFDPVISENLSVLTVPFIEWFMNTATMTPTALKDLAELLEEQDVKPWFSIPNPMEPTEADKMNALRVALKRVAQEKPKVFARLSSEALYVAGFNSEDFKKQEVYDLLDKLLAPQ